VSHRRSFSPKFKAQLVLDLLSGSKSQAELCREHQLSPYLLNSWKDAFLANASAAFESSGKTDPSGEADAARVAELERLVGRLALEVDILKKGSSALPHLRRKGGRS
jgi:transposase-like protein